MKTLSRTTAITTDLSAVTYASIEAFTGSTFIDTLIGLDSDMTWNITGPDSIDVDFGSFAANFDSFENLTGKSGDDRFLLNTNASISGEIDGGKA